MKSIISPSILACDFLNIENELSVFNKFNDSSIWIHLDIMDGHFVPNLTFGIPIVKQMTQRFPRLIFDAHLMVSNPEFHLEEMKDFNLHNFTFHFETFNSDQEIINLIKKYQDHYSSIGCSIKPKTNVEQLSLELLKNLNLVLVMSVEPGFGGQSFIKESFQKVKKLNELRYQHNLNFQIQVDGGVGDQNAKNLFDQGADNLVAGSFVFKNGPEQYLSQIQKLKGY